MKLDHIVPISAGGSELYIPLRSDETWTADGLSYIESCLYIPLRSDETLRILDPVQAGDLLYIPLRSDETAGFSALPQPFHFSLYPTTFR